MGFTRVDFVSEPGQYAVRGALVDIFSYSWNNPYRISFFGDEVDGISVFDCNSQLSKEKLSEVEIFADLSADGGAEGKTVLLYAVPGGRQKGLPMVDAGLLRGPVVEIWGSPPVCPVRS